MNTTGWFLVFPDKTIHPRWGYGRLRDLKEDAPGAITGLVVDWKYLRRMGYGYIRCQITRPAYPRRTGQMNKRIPA